MITQMCSNRALVDSLECCMDDLVECFEDFVKKSLILIFLGIGVIVGLLCYLLKLVSERPSLNSSLVVSQAVAENTTQRQNERNQVMEHNKKVEQEVLPNKIKDVEEKKVDKKDTKDLKNKKDIKDVKEIKDITDITDKNYKNDKKDKKDKNNKKDKNDKKDKKDKKDKQDKQNTLDKLDKQDKQNEEDKQDELDDNKNNIVTPDTDAEKAQTTTAVNTSNLPILPSFDENVLRDVGLSSCSKYGCGVGTHIYIPSRVPIPSTPNSSSKPTFIPCLRKRSLNRSSIPSLQICPRVTKPGSCCSMCCYDEQKRN